MHVSRKKSAQKQKSDGIQRKTVTVKINDYPINLTWERELSCYDDLNWFRINYTEEATLLIFKEMDYSDL